MMLDFHYAEENGCRLLWFDNQELDRALLSVAEPVFHEWKLAHQVSGKFKGHAAARRDAEGLLPVHRAFRWRFPNKRSRTAGRQRESSIDALVLRISDRSAHGPLVLLGQAHHDTALDAR